MARYLDDWELDMIAHGDATEEMVRALAASPEAQARLAQLQREEAQLADALFQADLPTTLELVDWHLKRLDPRRAQHISDLVAASPALQEEVAFLTAQLAAPLLPAEPSLGPWLRRIILTVDDFISKARPQHGPDAFHAAVRGERDEESLVFYSWEAYQVSLVQRRETEGVVTLEGSLFAPEEALRIALRQAEETRFEAPMSALNSFLFKGVPIGWYTLVLTLPEAELIIPTLNLGT